MEMSKEYITMNRKAWTSPMYKEVEMRLKIGDDVLVAMVVEEVRETENGQLFKLRLNRETSYQDYLLTTRKSVSENITEHLEDMHKQEKTIDNL